MASMSYYTNASNSTAFDVSRLTAPENLSLVATVLPAIAYPLLASGEAHFMLVWSAGLNLWSYHKQLKLRIEEQPHVSLPAWQFLLAFLYFLIGAGIGRNGPRQTQPRDAFPGAIILVLLFWSYLWTYALPDLDTVEMAYLTGLDLHPLIKFWTIAHLVSFPGWFMVLGRHFAPLLSRLTARRVSWLFRFYQEDIKANAEAYIQYTIDDFLDDLQYQRSFSYQRSFGRDTDNSAADLEYGATLSGKEGLFEWDDVRRSFFTPETITSFRDTISMLLVCRYVEPGGLPVLTPTWRTEYVKEAVDKL